MLVQNIPQVGDRVYHSGQPFTVTKRTHNKENGQTYLWNNGTPYPLEECSFTPPTPVEQTYPASLKGFRPGDRVVLRTYYSQKDYNGNRVSNRNFGKEGVIVMFWRQHSVDYALVKVPDIEPLLEIPIWEIARPDWIQDALDWIAAGIEIGRQEGIGTVLNVLSTAFPEPEQKAALWSAMTAHQRQMLAEFSKNQETK